MKRNLVTASVAGAATLVTLAGCTLGEPSTGHDSSRPASVVAPAPTSSTTVESTVLDDVLARADDVLELPVTTTRMLDLPFIGDPIVLSGPVAAVGTNGDVLVYERGDYTRLARVSLDGESVPVANIQDIGLDGRPHSGASAPASSEDVLAWLAHHDERDDLNISDFTVYTAGADGRHPRPVATSSPDIPDQGTGRNVAVPYWRERLMIMDGRVYWTESVRRTGDIDVLPDFEHSDEIGVAVMSAPVDGSAPAVETVAGWHHAEDLCAPPGSGLLVYLDSALSQVPRKGTATIHRAMIDAQGGTSDAVAVWSAPEPSDRYVATGASACGSTVAVTWSATEQRDDGTGASAVEIAHDGRTTVIEVPEAGYVVRPVVTDRAVFFSGVNGSIDGGVYVFDLGTNELYRTSLTPGFYDAVSMSRTRLAWRDYTTTIPGADGEYIEAHLAAPLLP